MPILTKLLDNCLTIYFVKWETNGDVALSSKVSFKITTYARSCDI